MELGYDSVPIIEEHNGQSGAWNRQRLRLDPGTVRGVEDFTIR